MAVPAKVRMTADDFANLPESNQIRELIDGELIMPGSPSDPHQDVVPATWLVLRELIKGKGGKIKIAPQDVYLDDYNVPQPDVFWGGAENSQCQLNQNGRWLGAPDLVVEVLSPSTQRYDRGKKYLMYEHFGVREYWLIDPVDQTVEVFVLTSAKFVLQGLYELEETFTSPVLDNQQVIVKKFFEV